MTEPETPDGALERSLRALNAGHALDAVAAALQGILQLQIVQHLQALGMAEEGQAPSGEGDPSEGEPNPFGECDSGHEVFTDGCLGCASDMQQVVDDTVKVEDERRER